MSFPPPYVSPGRLLFPDPEANRMIPTEILMSSRLYAPLALAIWVLVWSILKDGRRARPAADAVREGLSDAP
jgi:hypothetical protein